MRNINTLLIISICSLLMLILSCDDDSFFSTDISEEDYDCSNCYVEKPKLMNMKLKFSTLNNDDYVYYTVYEGNAFSSDIYTNGETMYSSIVISVEPDKKYTIVAEYYKNASFYYVINDCYPKLKYLENVCNDDCYQPNNISCDLTLKY
jgi:hypothetical protein